MNQPAIVAEQIQRALPNLKSGTLRMVGDWFGKPWDNFHTLVSAEAEGNCLILAFDGGETLRVWDPAGYEGDAATFRIQRASRVLWQWYYYGRPHLSENLYFREYGVSGSMIDATSNVDWYTPTFHPAIEAPAVELC